MIARIKQGTAFKLPNGAPWPSMYIMYVVEFQKRGLPHAHIAVRLCYDQPRSAADIDRLICAKLPTVTSCTAPAEDCDCDNHRVVRTVLSKMVHRCSKSYCVDEHGVCAKHFPKPVCAETHFDEGGFPVYTRGLEDVFVEVLKARRSASL